MRDQFMACGAFGTEAAARNGRSGIAFDGDKFAIAMKRQLAAADSAVRANRTSHLRAVIFCFQRKSFWAHRVGAGAVAAIQDLTDERPAVQEVFFSFFALFLRPKLSVFSTPREGHPQKAVFCCDPCWSVGAPENLNGGLAVLKRKA